MNYRDEVLRNCPPDLTGDFREKLLLGGMGVAGEAGEVADLIKKYAFHGTPFNKEKLIKEMGDVRWYLEYLAIAIGVTMEEVKEANVRKLRERYPNGFSVEAANAKRSEA